MTFKMSVQKGSAAINMFLNQKVGDEVWWNLMNLEEVYWPSIDLVWCNYVNVWWNYLCLIKIDVFLYSLKSILKSLKSSNKKK